MFRKVYVFNIFYYIFGYYTSNWNFIYIRLYFYGLYEGIACAIEGYKYNICRGIISIWNTIRKCDEISNKYIFDERYTCFPDCDDWCLKEKKKLK